MAVTIDRAIEILTAEPDSITEEDDQDYEDAHLLSIEALKRLKAGRPAPPSLSFLLLPGETNDMPG